MISQRTLPGRDRRASCPDARLVQVTLADRSYEVTIGSGVRQFAAAEIGARNARSAALVTSRPDDWLPDLGIPTTVVRIGDGERIKTMAVVETLCRRFADLGMTAADVVVACGGGTTTDVAGLAAALYHRGIPVVHLPTSLLAQVDASVGGKTAVNLPEGKNLVGCYWQPAAVFCDTDFLRTLPQHEWVNGYGEIARGHFIGTGDLRGQPLLHQITASVRMKAKIVSEDERGTGRHLLNYGHTLGHALEIATDFEIGHGEAVGIGTVFAGRLAGRMGRIGAARMREHVEVVAGYGLPTGLPAGVDLDKLVAIMRLDKKASGSLTFVLDGPRGPELVTKVAAADVLAALAEISGQCSARDR
jgi:5-deoxy-5-amino-3-dehydroquinate synthase